MELKTNNSLLFFGVFFNIMKKVENLLATVSEVSNASLENYGLNPKKCKTVLSEVVSGNTVFVLCPFLPD